MPALSTPVVLPMAALCCLAIALWVRAQYGWRAAGVMALLSVCTLTSVWFSFEVASLERWRSGEAWRTALVFAPPVVAFLAIRFVCSRRGGHTSRLRRRTWAFGLALLAGPAGAVYLSQLAPLGGPDARWLNLLWWAGACIAVYVAIPLVYARISGERIRDYGLSLGFIKTEAGFLLLIAPVILGLSLLAATDVRFQQTYPFYRPDDENWLEPRFLIFELGYGLSFVALEFFFRGFLVIAGSRLIGVHAVPVMAFSYCLLHLGKPLPECAASLVGGLLLGYLALRLRSVAVGVVAHLSLAWGVDAAVQWWR